MQIEWYNYLKKTSEYKQYKKKSRTRSIVALIIISAFWAIIVAATDFNNIDDASMIYLGILVIATILLIRYAYSAFLKRPAIVMLGTISDMREIRRTVNEEDKLQTRVQYQYLVQGENGEFWGDCIFDFINGRANKHSIGEQVIFFSMSPGNNYIIKYR